MMRSSATVIVPETSPSATDSREPLADKTCGLIDAVLNRPDADVGDDQAVGHYTYAVETFGNYQRMGSVELIKHLRLQVTSIEARVCAEKHGDGARKNEWAAEMNVLVGIREQDDPMYLDDTTDCMVQYMKNGWKHDPQYGGVQSRLAHDGCSNPALLYNRAVSFANGAYRSARMPWQLQAFMADQLKGRDTMERKMAMERERCHGVFAVSMTNTSDDLEWRRVRTGTVYTTKPSNESITAERARVAASKKRTYEGEDGGDGKKARCHTKPAQAGGGAMPFIVGSKRAVTKDVNARRPAPTNVQVPDNGLVPYRTDAVEHNPIGERECVIEALRAALGTRSVTRVSLGLPLKGDLNFKEVVRKFNQVRSPFQLRKLPPVPWSGLLTKEPGIYIGRALLRTGEAHYMVYDSWRHLIFVGGAPPPQEPDAIERLLLEDDDQEEPVPDVPHVGRSWFIEDDELREPAKFQEYMCKTLNVVGGINNLYSVHMFVKQARKTEYNTPEHYD